MRELIKIKKDYNITLDANLNAYLNSDFVFIPIKPNYKLLVKKGTPVLKEQIIMENNLNKVISPISGEASLIETKNVKGEEVPCLVIANDFKEKAKPTRKKELKADKDLIISKLYDFYFKYIASVLESTKINNLVINGIEDEPYIYNSNFILNKYSKEILEVADILSSTFNIKHTYVALKSSDSKNVEAYLSSVGTYPNISLFLLEDKYLLGTPFFLKERMNLHEVDTLVIDTETLYDIYNALKYNKHPVETFITISGPDLEKSKVIKVKIGTLLKDIIENNIVIKNNNVKYILDGLLTGLECDINKTIVTKSTKGLIIIPKFNMPEEPCNLCGMCYKLCPVKVNPKKVMDTGKKSTNCIDCGLCSYICPSHINLRKFLRGNEDEK